MADGKKGGRFSADYFRHSESGYKTYKDKLKSDSPNTPLDPEKQYVEDLTPRGIKIAREAATKYFEGLNPEKDRLYFVSSNEARALGTAKVYKEEAEKRGFVIIDMPEGRKKDDIAYRVTGGKVRTSKKLSVNPQNLVLDNIFMPADKRFEVNEKALTPDFLEKYNRAKAIVDADNKGSYGANLVAYSEKLREIFPEIKTAEQAEKEKLQSLIHTFGKYAKRHEEQGSEEDIKVLAFGHQDQMVGFLNREFGNADLKNCEAVSFDFDSAEKKVGVTYKGRRKTLEERFIIMSALGSLLLSLCGSLYPNLTGFAIAENTLFEISNFSEVFFLVGMILALTLAFGRIKNKD
jgi:hypothetical protein